MGGDEGVRRRDALSQWSQKERSYEELCNEFPDCACECCAEIPGTHGYISPEEQLIYVVRSSWDFNVKKGDKLPLVAKVALSKITNRGLSMIREGKVTECELNYTLKGLADNARREKGDNGGIVGVVRTKASFWRTIIDSQCRLCCVYDTPHEKISDTEFRRPSHADVIYSRPDEQSLNATRKAEIRNLAAAATGFLKLENFENIQEFRDGQYIELFPNSLPVSEVFGS